MSATATVRGLPRLAFVVPTAYPLGGVQTWLDYLVPGLVSRGWAVTMLLVDGEQSDALGYLKVHPFSDAHLVKSVTGSREGRIRALAEAIAQSGAELVVGVNIVDVYEAVARMRAYGWHELRLAAAMHALNVCYFDDVATWKHAIDGIVVTNRLAGAAFEAWSGVTADRIHYAQYGVPVSESPEPDHVTRVVELRFAGRFDDEQKRVRDIPGILHALDSTGVPFRLELAGAGPDEAALRSSLRPFGQRVEFRGRLDYATMQRSFFGAGTVALVTSDWETGPLVAYEALAAGSALVTSRYLGTGLEGSLRHEENCLIYEIGDVCGAARAISRLVDPEARGALARRGHGLVKHRYSTEASIEAWDRALQCVVASDPLGGARTRVDAPPSGWLDRRLGVNLAETVRRRLGIRFAHATAGGEWPHSYGRETVSGFRESLAALDRVSEREALHA